MNELVIKKIDYTHANDAADFIELLDLYSQDQMGAGKPLPLDIKHCLADRLAQRSDAITLLAYINGEAVGILNAFESFSTFAAKPLINIHDMFVKEQHRGQGIAQQLINSLKQIAIDTNCCKLTLEVLSNNEKAKRSYRNLGFEAYSLVEEVGTAEFWQLKLPS